jgi:hypothetical protein
MQSTKVMGSCGCNKHEECNTCQSAECSKTRGDGKGWERGPWVWSYMGMMVRRGREDLECDHTWGWWWDVGEWTLSISYYIRFWVIRLMMMISLKIFIFWRFLTLQQCINTLFNFNSLLNFGIVVSCVMSINYMLIFSYLNRFSYHFSLSTMLTFGVNVL